MLFPTDRILSRCLLKMKVLSSYSCPQCTAISLTRSLSIASFLPFTRPPRTEVLPYSTNSDDSVFRRKNLVPISETQQKILQKVINKEISLLPLYRFKYINGTRLFSRMKVYMTVFMTTVLPYASYVNYKANMVTQGEMLATVNLGLLSLATMYWMSMYSRRWIGYVYVTQDGEWIMISHLTFWGNRRNVLVEADRVLPASTDRGGSLVKKLQIDQSHEHFYYFAIPALRTIYDTEAFYLFLGRDRKTGN